MTSITIHLPDELAEKAQKVGLLDAEQVVELIKQAVNRPQATENQKRLLQQTSGIWQHGDGLQWQIEQRQEWEQSE